jgi:hypothetical protein
MNIMIDFDKDILIKNSCFAYYISLIWDYIGNQGPKGDPALPGPPPKSRGYFFTRHSQSVQDPICPSGSNLLWCGYSLLHMTGEGKDLGTQLITQVNH